MKRLYFECKLCETEISSSVDLVRAVLSHLKRVHSALAAASLTDDEIREGSYSESKKKESSHERR